LRNVASRYNSCGGAEGVRCCIARGILAKILPSLSLVSGVGVRETESICNCTFIHRYRHL
jgi:hypothetical protein